jgi:hypothetical protein
MSKHHLLPHKPAAHFAVDKNALWGIVKCWQAWSSQQNKGVAKHCWHQNTRAKSPHAQNWKRADLKTKVVPFLNLRSFARIYARFAWICARFAPSLRALQPFFLKNARFAMTNGTASWKSAQRSQHLTNYLMMFHVQSDPATYECTRNTRVDLETRGEMEPMRPTGGKKCSSFKKHSNSKNSIKLKCALVAPNCARMWMGRKF